MIPVFVEKLHLSHSDVRAVYLLEFCVPAIISTIGYWIRRRRDIPVEELGRLMRDVLRAGIMAQAAKYAAEPLGASTA
jgi:hypothetical protein